MFLTCEQSDKIFKRAKSSSHKPIQSVPDEKIAVKRYQGLMRDSWIAWVVIFLFGAVLGFAKHPLFFSAIPIGIFAFFYFGFMRYDEHGNAKEGL